MGILEKQLLRRGSPDLDSFQFDKKGGTMIYECKYCKKRLYVEAEFTDHIKNVHLNGLDDERVVKHELASIDHDLKKVKEQEGAIQVEATRFAVEENRVKWRC